MARPAPQRRVLSIVCLSLMGAIAPLLLVSNFLHPVAKLLLSSGPSGPVNLLTTSLVVLVFWLFSLVLLVRRFHQPVIQLLFYHSQVLAITMVYPLSTPFPWPPNPPGLLYLSIVGFYFLGPLTFHLNSTFPVQLGSPAQRRFFLTATYVLALVAIWTWRSGNLLLKKAGEIYTIGLLLASILAMIYAYLSHATPAERRRMRVIWFGTITAIFSTNIMFFIPGLFGWPILMPVWVAGLLLLLVPASYIYTITRQNLFGIDRFLNRSLVYFLLVVGIAAVYFFLLTRLYSLFHLEPMLQALISAGLTVLIAFNFHWLYAWIQRLVDRAFYGRRYDYAEVVDQVSSVLSQCHDRQSAAEALAHQTAELMNLKEGKLFLGDPTTGDRPTAALRFDFNLEGGHHAIWWVAGRLDGEVFSSEDRRILNTLARQAEITLNNIVLVEGFRRQIEEIRLSREALADMQRQMMRSREDERARLARDLHDGPIQSLVGLNVQLGMLVSTLSESAAATTYHKTPPQGDSLPRALSEMREDIRVLLSGLRRVCVELRPPMLDMVGLGAAVRGLAQEWAQHHPVALVLDLPPDADLHGLPDETAVNLYRIVQEALKNISLHAAAKNVSIAIRGDASCLELRIVDDGCGFEVDRVLAQAPGKGHFGLAGMQERSELIGAELRIRSAPGSGSSLNLFWPKQIFK
jgi:signal transduction histidine kinase